MPTDGPEVHLRVAIPDDATWLSEVDRTTAGVRSPAIGWDRDPLIAELDSGAWSSDDQWAWAVLVDGRPAGFALVTGMTSGDGQMQIRLKTAERGQGVGREVLRQLADHHFAAHPHLQRLVGETHEQNIPMQRAFNAAGFRMEARYRDSMAGEDGALASRWGYALTRQDWTVGRHRIDDDGYDLHGLTFIVDEVLDGPKTGSSGLTFDFFQDGRRASASFWSHEVNDGELGGVLIRDVLRYHYVQELHRQGEGHMMVTGRGRARIQRAQDGRLQVINEWADDDGRHGTTLLVERR